MGTALIYLVVMVVVAGALFLAAAVVFGRGEELAALPAGHTAAVLPACDVQGEDVRALRFQQVVRGYKADEVDWALERLAIEIDGLRAQLAVEEQPRLPTSAVIGDNGRLRTAPADLQQASTRCGGHTMAAMKPRTGDGPLEATKEGRGIVMRVPLEGGGRLVVELTPDEASALGDELKGVTS